MGNQRLTFFIIYGLYRDYTTPKRLKVTYSTSRDPSQEARKRQLGARARHFQLLGEVVLLAAEPEGEVL